MSLFYTPTLRPASERQPRVDPTSGRHILINPVQIGNVLLCRCVECLPEAQTSPVSHFRMKREVLRWDELYDELESRIRRRV